MTGASSDGGGTVTPDGENAVPGGTDTMAGRYQTRTRVGRWLFGDRIGLALFLAAVCFAALTWRAGLFITDNETLSRTLEAVSEGRLWIETVGEGPAFGAPGAEVRDGRVYGRNYGQVVASLPALWLLQGLDAVADLRMGLVAGWHLAVLAFGVVASGLLGGRRVGTLVTAPFVLGSFVLNIALMTQFREPELSLLALQVTAVVAAGFGAVVVYRVLAVQGDRRVATVAGGATVIVLPVGFWAVVPKRHVFTVLAVMTVLFLFAVSRRSAGRVLPVVGRVPLARAGAYATVGLLSWVHAAEGLFVLLVLVAVDLPTAPHNDPRALATVGAAFAVSVIPTLVTNLLVTGEMARPPRTLGGGITTPVAGGSGGGGGSGSEGVLSTLGDLPGVGPVGWLVGTVLGITADSAGAATDPRRLVSVFVRSAGSDLAGSRPGFVGDPQFAGTNLAVLETAPVLALCVVVAGAWLARLRNGFDRLRRVDPTVVLAAGIAAAFVALYLSRLPLYAQLTQRYLLPLFPLVLYLLARSELAGRLADVGDSFAWSYVAGVLVGGQLFVVAVVVRDLPPGEGAQLNAAVSLVAAVLVVVTGGLSVWTRRADRLTAAVVGLACAAGTVFLLVAHLRYFAGTGEAVLPVVEALSDRL